MKKYFIELGNELEAMLGVHLSIVFALAISLYASLMMNQHQLSQWDGLP